MQQERIRTSTAECPSCGAWVKLDRRMRIGQTLKCRSCREKLVVTWLNPVELDMVADDRYDDWPLARSPFPKTAPELESDNPSSDTAPAPGPTGTSVLGNR